MRLRDAFGVPICFAAMKLLAAGYTTESVELFALAAWLAWMCSMHDRIMETGGW